jgi:phage shock protein C
MEKKLYRSTSDRKICGVCGGIAAYFNLDPTLVRVLWAALSLFAGGGIILYLVAALLMPEEPKE